MPGTVPEALNEGQQKLLSLLKLVDSIESALLRAPPPTPAQCLISLYF